MWYIHMYTITLFHYEVILFLIVSLHIYISYIFKYMLHFYNVLKCLWIVRFTIRYDSRFNYHVIESYDDMLPRVAQYVTSAELERLGDNMIAWHLKGSYGTRMRCIVALIHLSQHCCSLDSLGWVGLCIVIC